MGARGMWQGAPTFFVFVRRNTKRGAFHLYTGANPGHQKGTEMKTTLLIVALATGAVLTTTSAQAQDRGPAVFEELDLNSDGQVTLEELEGQKAARFAAADTDGDGALSEAEMLARANEGAAERADRKSVV